ncbi:MAG TPA: hypothetical protein VGA70_04765 [Longimicrobiales bacterium]|jgi:hypothetical protein
MRSTSWALVTLGVLSCSPDAGGDAADRGDAGGPAPAAANSLPERFYEQSIVLMTTSGDSLMLVPWFFTALTTPEGIDREARAWLHRGDSWELFFSASWRTPPMRAPWRIMPRESMRILVGEGDAVEGLVFDEGLRQLDVALESSMAEWSGARGETFHLLEGSVALSSGAIPGVVLHVSRGRGVADAPAGDWAFVASGDSLHLVLQSPTDQPPGTPLAYRSWALLADSRLEWPGVTVAWTRERAFEAARRNVPVAWSIASDDGDLVGELEVRSAQMEAGPGEEPQLPVDAIFEVVGTVGIGGATYPVRGFLRHLQR